MLFTARHTRLKSFMNLWESTVNSLQHRGSSLYYVRIFLGFFLTHPLFYFRIIQYCTSSKMASFQTHPPSPFADVIQGWSLSHYHLDNPIQISICEIFTIKMLLKLNHIISFPDFWIIRAKKTLRHGVIKDYSVITTVS